ncbi:retrotransposon protein, putative, ty3-gypsy subclass [Tanacetum coccineum]
MGDVGINTLTTEQYLALTRGNQASGVVKPEIKELRRDWWTDYLQEQLTPRILIKKAIIQRYCPPFKMAKQLEEIHNFKQEGPPGYYKRTDNQPPFGERKPSLTEIITKYIEESAKKEVEHEEWLRKLQESTNFSDEEETEKLKEIKDVIAKYEPTCQKVKPSNLPVVSFYVTPYELPIPFPRRLEQHVVEALVHKAIESLKKMKNQLPSKEQDPGSFTLPCSIGKLTFNTLADLGESISLMPLLMFKRLGIGGLKPINMTIEMADITQSTPKESQNKINYIGSNSDQGKPWEIEANKELNRERDIDLSSVIKLKEHWCDLPDNTKEKCYWCCLNNDKRIDVAWEGLSLNDWIRVRYGKDLENFGEEKIELILDTVLDKLDDGWFSGIVKDEEDLDGITPPPILIEKVKVTRYIISLRECYTKGRILQINELPMTSAKLAAIRAELKKEVDTEGSVQRET